jgi:hypothetical protein
LFLLFLRAVYIKIDKFESIKMMDNGWMAVDDGEMAMICVLSVSCPSFRRVAVSSLEVVVVFLLVPRLKGLQTLIMLPTTQEAAKKAYSDPSSCRSLCRIGTEAKTTTRGGRSRQHNK